MSLVVGYMNRWEIQWIITKATICVCKLIGRVFIKKLGAANDYGIDKSPSHEYICIPLSVTGYRYFRHDRSTHAL